MQWPRRRLIDMRLGGRHSDKPELRVRSKLHAPPNHVPTLPLSQAAMALCCHVRFAFVCTCVGIRSLFAEAARNSISYAPRDAYLQACAEWLPRFNTDAPTPIMTLDDVVFLCDMLYLPFEHGDGAARFLSVAQAVITRKDPSQLPELQTLAERIHSVYNKLTTIHHRALCYTLYRFLWDAKEEADVLSQFGAWLHSPGAAAGEHARLLVVSYNTLCTLYL